MTDQELIAAGRQAAGTVERAQLELGRLALAYAPIGDPSVKTGTYGRLREYAEAIGVDEGTLRNYRAVAHAWQDYRDAAAVYGFTVLKALTPVAHKDRLLAAMSEAEPPTKSGRWTAAAAVEFAREGGYWSHAAAPGAGPTVLTTLRNVRAALARIAAVELSYDETTDALNVLAELRMELDALRQALTGRAAKRAEDLAA